MTPASPVPQAPEAASRPRRQCAKSVMTPESTPSKAKKPVTPPSQSNKRALDQSSATESPRKKARATGSNAAVGKTPTQVKTKWEVVVAKPLKVQSTPRVKDGRRPKMWASTMEEFVEVMPSYLNYSPDGLVHGYDAMFMTSAAHAQDGDGWSDEQRVLTVSFTRRFSRTTDWTPSEADAAVPPCTPDPQIQSDPSQGERSQPPQDAPVNTPIAYPNCVSPTGIRSTQFDVPLSVSEPPLRDLNPSDLELPDDIASLFLIGQYNGPILLVCSDKWTLKPHSFTGVAFMGWFAVERIDEEVLSGHGKFSGTVRWRVRLSYRYSDECPPWWMDEPWPTEPRAVNWASDLLPTNLLRYARRDGLNAPRGWMCPQCGRLNARSHVHAYTCASCPNESIPAPILDSRALRPLFVGQRPSIPDLEITLHADAKTPPRASIFDDGSVVLTYPSEENHDVVHHLANMGMLRGDRSHSLFEDVQRKGFFALVTGNGMVDAARVLLATEAKQKQSRPTFGFAQSADALPDVHEILSAILEQCEVDVAEHDQRTIVGLMSVEPCKGLGIRLPPNLDNVVLLSLGANVMLSCSSKAQTPRFTMHLHHGDGVVLAQPRKALHWEARSEDAMMLLMSYKTHAAPSKSRPEPRTKHS